MPAYHRRVRTRAGGIRGSMLLWARINPSGSGPQGANRLGVLVPSVKVAGMPAQASCRGQSPTNRGASKMHSKMSGSKGRMKRWQKNLGLLRVA